MIKCILLFTVSDWIALVGIIVAIIGIVIPILILLFTSGNKFGQMIERIDNIKETVNDIKPDVKTIPVINERVTILWTDRYTVANSPITLNERGNKVLKDSKIETLTDEYYAEILKQVKVLNPQNAYQAQEILIEVVKNLKSVDNCRNKLEEAAFVTGVDVDTILLVAAINIRDKVISDLKFEIGDIDKFTPPQNKS